MGQDAMAMARRGGAIPSVIERISELAKQQEEPPAESYDPVVDTASSSDSEEDEEAKSQCDIKSLTRDAEAPSPAKTPPLDLDVVIVETEPSDDTPLNTGTPVEETPPGASCAQ